jgi:heterodisulfide reductase subunit A-like polyferredoxin
MCCTEAIKNALAYKEKMPDGEVYILYKDVRTYGFKEDYYERASAEGVRFIRYDDDALPRVEMGDGDKLHLFVYDNVTGEELELTPELCVLSAGIHPNSGNVELSEMLKVPISRDGFFLEAHMKLRPVDFYTEGVFLCGLAHSPKSLSETLGQAYGAVARANTVLAQDHLELGGIVASVESEKCAVCLTCVRVCPYQIPTIDENNVASIEIAKCQGCGVCVAECPAKAIQLAHFKDHQVIAETDALLCVEEGDK